MNFSSSFQVRSLDRPTDRHSFQTIDRVHILVHSVVGDYLASLEGVPGERGASVRAYVNWADKAVDGAPIRQVTFSCKRFNQLDGKLSWKPHIENKIKKAKRTLMAIRPTIGKSWGPSPMCARWSWTGVFAQHLLMEP
jgi:hypothetical protein